MHDLLNKRVAELGTYTVSGANNLFWAPGVPAEVTRLIFVFTTANTTTKNVITCKRRPIAGTAANEVTLGTFDLPATSSLGYTYYLNVGIDNAATDPGDGSVYEVARDHWTIKPGEDFGIYSDGGGTAGVCNVYVEYVAGPFAGSNINATADAVEVAQVT